MSTFYEVKLRTQKQFRMFFKANCLLDASLALGRPLASILAAKMPPKGAQKESKEKQKGARRDKIGAKRHATQQAMGAQFLI